MEYYAIHRSNPDDELTHWKYIKKKKINGKWRYFYDKSELDKFNKGYEKTTVKNLKNGDDIKITKKYKKTNDLFSGQSVSTFRVSSHGTTSTHKKITYKQGSLSRLKAKGEKFIYDKFLKNKVTKKPNSSKISQLADKGKKFIDKLFGKDDSKKDKKKKLKPKYIAKVKTPNGKTRYFYNKDEYNSYLRRLDYQKNEPDFMKGIKKIDKNTILNSEENQEATNPNYDPYDDDYSMNCIKCTATYELRMRGYDVEAAPADKRPGIYSSQNSSDLDNWYKDAKHYEIQPDGTTKDISLSRKNGMFETVDTIYKKFSGKYEMSYSGSDIRNALEKNNPPNSRGDISTVWTSGGGHSMVYEIDSKGKAIIRDCQTNRIYRSDDDFEAIARSSGNVSFTRTDNLELRKGILVNVKRK